MVLPPTLCLLISKGEAPWLKPFGATPYLSPAKTTFVRDLIALAYLVALLTLPIGTTHSAPFSSAAVIVELARSTSTITTVLGMLWLGFPFTT